MLQLNVVILFCLLLPQRKRHVDLQVGRTPLPIKKTYQWGNSTKLETDVNSQYAKLFFYSFCSKNYFILHTLSSETPPMIPIFGSSYSATDA